MKHKIKDIRKIKGITQKELAEQIGMTQQAYSQIENSDNITLNTLEKVADALGCSVIDLVPHEEKNGLLTFESPEVFDLVHDSVVKTEVKRADRAYDICSAAGYKWIVPDELDGFIHLIDKKSKIEYAVTDEAFTAAVDGSADYIKYNFEKLIGSAKIVNNGNETKEEI